MPFTGTKASKLGEVLKMRKIILSCFGTVMVAFLTVATVGATDLRSGGFGRPETITGTITMVVPEERTVIVKVEGTLPPQQAGAVEDVNSTTYVKTANEVEYRFKLTGSSLIQVGDHATDLSGLADQTNKRVSVTFVPRRDGNFVQNIRVE